MKTFGARQTRIQPLEDTSQQDGVTLQPLKSMVEVTPSRK